MMTTEKKSIHKALTELKVISQRIEKAINNSQFIVANKHSNTKICGRTIQQYSDKVKSEYQSIVDLIARRDAIKRAITHSNAVTDIVI